MDGIYRGQRHIYDITRKYYLFGRDGLIEHLDAPSGATVLEIACGTGRNLAAIRRRWPGTVAHGLDISEEMLKSARDTLGPGARLAQGDACSFDPVATFGRGSFDRVVLSYSLSMIPDWEGALQHAARLLAPGGSLHVVDFGPLATMPVPFAEALRSWLARFHVSPRVELHEATLRACAINALDCEFETGPWDYFQRATLRRPPG
ncbi:class I SAM-dependent methyltransferase [Qipengyuania sp. 6D47A]|uniref:Class I SAM-dependent methyltransferase n=2 Tax=Qipengyuania qiaonensis TaxID=2867240 RepID=A0ABS7J9Q0_9SPHN|nr:class I SAM-dependent methyltransferase [Qipengyuania qiaonensis]